MDDIESLRELELLQEALFNEKVRVEFKRSLAELKRLKPKQPKQPAPPKQQEPDFAPIPYPDIQLPDFGMSPWYRASLTLLLIVVILVCLFLLSLCTPVQSIPYVSEVLAIAGGSCGLLLWLALMFFLAGFIKDDKRPDRYIAKVQASPEYQQQCREIDAQNAAAYQQAQVAAFQQYQQAIHYYNTVTIPEYNEQLRHYQTTLLPQWEDAMQKCNQGMQMNTERLASLYAQSHLPQENRNIDALEFIVQYMETSQCDLEKAITAYEMKRVNDLLQQTLLAQEQQTREMQETLEDQQELIEQLSEQLDDAHESIKSQKRWNMANTALAGYAAYKSRKIGKQIDEKEKS